MMENISENPMWTPDSQDYGHVSSTFATMALILGAIGVVGAIIMFYLSLMQIGNGGFGGMIAAIALAFQSIMLIVFGSMMHLLSKVLLAVFEMSLGETRMQIKQAEADQESDS